MPSIWNTSTRINYLTNNNMQIPALAYHRVCSGFQVGLNGIPPSRFKSHISGLANLGLSGRTTYDTLDDRSVLITFDDGYESVYNFAYPICENYNFKGIVFTISDYVGKKNTWDINFGLNHHTHMNSRMLKNLSENGWEIASHGCHHLSYSGLKYSEIYTDMAISKEVIEQLTGNPVQSFTAPYNMMVPVIFPIAQELGYKNIFVQKSISDMVYKTTLNVIERRFVYSIDKFKTILKKIENTSRLELYKENFIHFCSSATIGVKELI